MQRDDNLCIGAIMEASYKTRRVTQGIIEMVEYLRNNQDILLAESKNDLFNLFFALAIQAHKKNYDVKPLLNEMDRIAEVIKKLGIYSGKLVDMRIANVCASVENISGRSRYFCTSSCISSMTLCSVSA